MLMHARLQTEPPALPSQGVGLPCAFSIQGEVQVLLMLASQLAGAWQMLFMHVRTPVQQATPYAALCSSGILHANTRNARVTVVEEPCLRCLASVLLGKNALIWIWAESVRLLYHSRLGHWHLSNHTCCVSAFATMAAAAWLRCRACAARSQVQHLQCYYDGRAR
jgi:hypothetical protein